MKIEDFFDLIDDIRNQSKATLEQVEFEIFVKKLSENPHFAMVINMADSPFIKLLKLDEF